MSSASRAAALYVGAANGVPADLVGASDVSELSSRTKYGSAAADEDHGLIDDVTVAKEQLAGAQAEFEKSRAAAEAKKSGLADTRNQLAAAQDKQQALLAQNKGEIATLAAQIEAQKRAADEAKARAEFQRRQRRSRQGTGHRRGLVAPFVRPPHGFAGRASRAAAERWRRHCRGHRDGPDRQALPVRRRRPGFLRLLGAHDVRVGRSRGPAPALLRRPVREPPARPDQGDLQPGDLVFYGSPIHHVGMYIGNGQYVHAPQTGDVVKVASAFRGDYVGGARP